MQPSKPVFDWADLLTAKEVAEIARVHVNTLRRWVAEGDGPVVTLLRPGEQRFSRADVYEWLTSRKQRICAGER